MNKIETSIPDVFLIEPKVFGDERGFFYESWNKKTLASIGLDVDFVQDNHSKSQRGVLRGLHYQIQHPQGKLVRVGSRRGVRCGGGSAQIVVRRLASSGWVYSISREQATGMDSAGLCTRVCSDVRNGRVYLQDN